MSKRTEIEKYLETLDGIRRAEPKPFFTGRVMNRLQTDNPATHSVWSRWGWSLSALSLLILLNVLLLVFRSSSERSVLSEYDKTTPDWVMEYTANPSAPIYDNLNR